MGIRGTGRNSRGGGRGRDIGDGMLSECPIIRAAEGGGGGRRAVLPKVRCTIFFCTCTI